jgi:hypothetical protein
VRLELHSYKASAYSLPAEAGTSGKKFVLCGREIKKPPNQRSGDEATTLRTRQHKFGGFRISVRPQNI